jgi:hypothetical protein
MILIWLDRLCNVCKLILYFNELYSIIVWSIAYVKLKILSYRKCILRCISSLEYFTLGEDAFFVSGSFYIALSFIFLKAVYMLEICFFGFKICC